MRNFHKVPVDSPPSWASPFLDADGPRYLQIVGFLERAITTGMLNSGDRLPPQRQLATQFGVDLTTITRSFNEARRRHLIEARGALGTFIAMPKAEFAQRIDLSMNIPPPPAGVDLKSLLRNGISQVMMRSDTDLLMTYHLGGGSEADREAGAKWLEPMLGCVDSARVVSCPGTQAALAALILALTQPGDAILTEPLVYPGLPLAAEQLGRRVEVVAADAHGMRPDALEAACRQHDARLVYLNPTLQNPTAATIPEARRHELLAGAARCNLRIIEDDPYWLFADDPPPPFASLMPNLVYYLSTMSKCLTPGLRTAFLVLPDSRDADGFLTVLRSFSLMSTSLTSALVTQWVHDGSAAQVLAGVKAEAEARQDLAALLLTGRARPSPCRGIHVWQLLPSYWTPNDLAAAAREAGLVVAPSTAFHRGTNPPNAVRISLGGSADRSQLSTALKKLSALLAQPSPARQRILV
ncbi:PLP-dependent aminotransferase family protein [Paraburkholderia denitrificans]|uniref:PLP-dependent aminotransferase family protein n=1 Tax=Paraburkholderia denitrificans TaxID=694025 RepID=A0ABW0JDM0_9BURK